VTSRQAAARRRGADFEIDLLNLFREEGWDAERLHLAGRDDEGDLVVREGDGFYTIIEAKAEKELNSSGYITEVLRERENFCKRRGLDHDHVMPVVIWKRPGQPIRNALVMTTFGEMFG
jgi:hypothetical protein